MDNPMQGQFEQFRQQAAQSGFSGSGLIDVRPGVGVIRLKLNIPPPANQKMFTQQFAQGLAVMLDGMNISVKIHTSEEAAGDGD
jgi:hypothetical protein